MFFFHSLVTPSLLAPNILLSTLFSNNLSLHSSLNVSDQVSNPYKTTGTMLYISVLRQMTKETKLISHNITAKAAWNEIW
jgi:hypothetical protein